MIEKQTGSPGFLLAHAATGCGYAIVSVCILDRCDGAIGRAASLTLTLLVYLACAGIGVLAWWGAARLMLASGKFRGPNPRAAVLSGVASVLALVLLAPDAGDMLVLLALAALVPASLGVVWTALSTPDERPQAGVTSIASCSEESETANAKMATRWPDAKSECESLLSALLPLAEQMLSHHGEFYPFGGTMSTTGEIAQSAAWTGEERPPSQALIDQLRVGFRAAAKRSEIRATAIVYDTLVVPPGKTSKQGAVTVALDHRDDYSVVVVFPYSRRADGTVQFDPPFASHGSGEVFGR